MVRYRVLRKLRHLLWTIGLRGPVPQLVVRDADLMVNRLTGTSDRLVLVFTSKRGHGRRLSYIEFPQIAADNGRNHVLFITDVTHSWYGRPGLIPRIERIVNDYIAANRISDVRAIGNSMGGFGAILFSRSLPISHVAAFVPQIAITPEILARPSWDGWRDAVPVAAERTLVPILIEGRARITLVFGTVDADDTLQRGLVPDAAPVEMVVLPGFGHDLARSLNDRGLLGGLVGAMLDGDAEKLARFRVDRIAAAA